MKKKLTWHPSNTQEEGYFRTYITYIKLIFRESSMLIEPTGLYPHK
jgi:hypothetical protein